MNEDENTLAVTTSGWPTPGEWGLLPSVYAHSARLMANELMAKGMPREDAERVALDTLKAKAGVIIDLMQALKAKKRTRKGGQHD